MKPAHEILYNLHSFTGTEQWHRYSPLFSNILLTDGTKYLAEECQAYWLMDMIASHTPSIKDRFAIAILAKVEDNKALFSLVDDIPAGKTYAEQCIEYTDFPLDEIKLYVIKDGDRWVILLPSEY